MASEQLHNQLPETPKKPKYCEPRYVGDIKSPHIATPRSAKRCLKLAKQTIHHQKLKIKSLQQQKRNLNNRIKNLEALIEHLKKKNLISGSSADTMVVSISGYFCFFFCFITVIKSNYVF